MNDISRASRRDDGLQEKSRVGRTYRASGVIANTTAVAMTARKKPANERRKESNASCILGARLAEFATSPLCVTFGLRDYIYASDSQRFSFYNLFLYT